jgi:hypothetical protein
MGWQEPEMPRSPLSTDQPEPKSPLCPSRVSRRQWLRLSALACAAAALPLSRRLARRRRRDEPAPTGWFGHC